ncbi:(2Fe-2S)-binding protein [Mycobacterium nebraskense]|uniref:Iron reductase n=1 Tax=Mycobacterium nebraskense TaxID=244292 RepID=A0A1X1YVQ8_9MYCO|nr:(2Fe-2S)-binding protein [Mycobacterium nebraskense]MBI2692675.1 (2Fe-2S)-binding protein [Mycobacterium nebraskense]MCV7121316.1 (2Fe-2S)-binding protein [Mycobacterium nebraskense]ORW15051.1 iron reductase [Mycobacterium nebraskense]
MDISAELAEISSHKGFFALTVGGDAAGWSPVGRYYADGFTDLVDATASRHRTTDLRIAASLVHLGHATRLWSPVLACALGHGVVPDLDDLQRADDGAPLRLPAPVGIPANSPDVLYRVVVQEHMQPLAAGLRVGLAPALLAGNVASALTGAARALLAARPDLGPRIAEMTHALLGTGLLAGSGVVTGPRLGFKRRSCCLFYRLPGRSVCGDCVFETSPSNRT